MTTLEDLYYGNISPHERYIKRGTRVDKLVKLICKNEEELNSTLTEKQKETFEKKMLDEIILEEIRKATYYARAKTHEFVEFINKKAPPKTRESL